MNKKYKLSDRDKNGMYHIIALRDIPRWGVEAGDKGGLVYGYYNLSQEGNCWIKCYAVVCDNAFVCDDAFVNCNAVVCDDAIVRDCACICNYGYTSTKICGNAIIGGMIHLYSGTWEATPKVIKGSAYDVIYNAKQIAIGCECHSLKWWKEHGLALAKKDNFTPEQIEEYQGHLNIIKFGE